MTATDDRGWAYGSAAATFPAGADRVYETRILCGGCDLAVYFDERVRAAALEALKEHRRVRGCKAPEAR